MKKIMAILVILMLFLLTTVSFTMAINETKTLYVDDDGTAEFTSIQDAIEASSQGDTIFVYSGTYHENLQIDKTLTLTGEEKSSTIISGLGYGNVVNITADSVVMQGFFVTDGIRWGSGIFVHDTVDVSIINCTIAFNNGIGVELDLTKHAQVLNCVIAGNEQFGIVVYTSDGSHINSDNNIISNCDISTNTEGIFLDDIIRCTVTNNKISSNDEYGVHIVFVQDCQITKNNFIFNHVDAFFEGRYRNTWSQNYWQKSMHLGMKIIFGKIVFIPWLNFDKNPSDRPYEIGGN